MEHPLSTFAELFNTYKVKISELKEGDVVLDGGAVPYLFLSVRKDEEGNWLMSLSSLLEGGEQNWFVDGPDEVEIVCLYRQSLKAFNAPPVPVPKIPCPKYTPRASPPHPKVECPNCRTKVSLFGTERIYD